MKSDYSDQQLQAFLDEALPTELMAQIELEMRSDQSLIQRLAFIAGQRDAGVHGLGEIWRRHRLTCPNRQQLGGYLLGTLDQAWQAYVQFHLEQVGCRVCAANLQDLKSEQQQMLAATEASQAARSQRRRRYLESTAGYLNNGEA